MFWLKNKKIIFLLHTFYEWPEVCFSTCSCLSMQVAPSHIVFADFAELFGMYIVAC